MEILERFEKQTRKLFDIFLKQSEFTGGECQVSLPIFNSEILDNLHELKKAKRERALNNQIVEIGMEI